MKASRVVVWVAVLAMLGCDTIKGFMPGPTANKAVTVPANAGLVAYGTPDVLTLPLNSPGAFYIVEDDTSKVVSVFNDMADSGATRPLPVEQKNQLDTKRKYRMYYVSNRGSTQPTTIPMM